jgi:hypothetical protein
MVKDLLNAPKKGVRIEVFLDKSQRREKYSEADFLAHAGIPTLIDAAHAIAHNKVTVIDGETVVTGEIRGQNGVLSLPNENDYRLTSRSRGTRQKAAAPLS